MGIFDKAPPPSAAPEFIEVGQIVNTHGVRGEVKVQPWDVSAERLCTFKTFYMDGVPFRPLQKRVHGLREQRHDVDSHSSSVSNPSIMCTVISRDVVLMSVMKMSFTAGIRYVRSGPLTR